MEGSEYLSFHKTTSALHDEWLEKPFRIKGFQFIVGVATLIASLIVYSLNYTLAGNKPF